MVHTQNLRMISPAGRLLLAVAGMCVLLLLVTARGLEPDPRGFGTHEQLGLTPCSFYRWTGRVCPTCGATTAWAYALRGEWAAAARANLAGMLLCVVAVAGMPWWFLSASIGRWLFARPTLRVVLAVGSGWAVLAVLDWVRRAWF
jgi:hypothetical protein